MDLISYEGGFRVLSYMKRGKGKCDGGEIGGNIEGN